jgi:hypothetical protein
LSTIERSAIASHFFCRSLSLHFVAAICKSVECLTFAATAVNSEKPDFRIDPLQPYSCIMAKKRVGVLLRESIGGKQSSNKSSDLAALTQRYIAFTKKMRAMVEALKAQHACMIQMEESRLKVRCVRH